MIKLLTISGNVKTIAGGQDARLYYLDIDGNRKKYLLEGEIEVPGVDIDLSNYQTTDRINLQAFSNDTLVNKIYVEGDYAQYGIGAGTKYIDFYSQYFKFWTPDAGYHYTGVDFQNVSQVFLPTNTTVNGEVILPAAEEITGDNWMTPEDNKLFIFTDPLSNISDSYNGYVKNCVFKFKTASSIEYNLSFGENIKINRPIEFLPDTNYIIIFDQDYVYWMSFIEA